MISRIEPQQVDTPLGGLPATQRVLLSRAQIDVALVEIRYSATDSSVSTEQGLDFQARLSEAGITLPRMQPAQRQQVALNFGPAGPSSQVEVQGSGWQYFSSDESIVLTFMSDAIAIQTTKYERWSLSILPLLMSALSAVENILRPELVYRVGLRYVNRLVDEHAESPQSWIGRINPAVLGVIQDEILGSRLISTQQQMELRLGDSQGALVRHGSFVDTAARGASSYLIDTDVFLTDSDRFVVPSILDRARQLNLTALSLFQQIVTEDYRAQLGPIKPDVKE